MRSGRAFGKNSGCNSNRTSSCFCQRATCRCCTPAVLVTSAAGCPCLTAACHPATLPNPPHPLPQIADLSFVLTEEEVASGLTLLCMARPVSDVVRIETQVRSATRGVHCAVHLRAGRHWQQASSARIAAPITHHPPLPPPALPCRATGATAWAATTGRGPAATSTARRSTRSWAATGRTSPTWRQQQRASRRSDDDEEE